MLFIHSLMLILLSLPLWAQDESPTTPAPINDEAPEGSIDGTSSTGTDTEAQADTPLNEEAAQERVQPNPSKRRMLETVKHLNLYQRSEEVIKFSDAEASISGLYLPENTGRPQGGILILHDIEQHAHWPYTIAPLREYLPDYGWNTLSLFFGNYINEPLPNVAISPEADSNNNASPQLPVTNEMEEPDLVQAPDMNNEMDTPPVADSTEDQNFDSDGGADALDVVSENFEAFSIPATLEDTAQSEITEDPPEMLFLKTMHERVEGGLSQLNTLGQFNLVIIAHGLSANWAVETLKKRFEQNPNIIGYSLIIIDAKSSKFPDYPLNDELAKLSIPILDLYTDQSEENIRTITKRKNTITRMQKSKYMQLSLPAIETIHTNEHNMVSRRVRGWLKTHAAGEEVTVKEKRT